LLQELDRELTPEGYELVLIAMDGGEPRRSASLIIDIDVGDINDNNPEFDRATYEVDVSENVGIGTTVIRLIATDLDSGSNGHVRYRYGTNDEYRNLLKLRAFLTRTLFLQKIVYRIYFICSL